MSVSASHSAVEAVWRIESARIVAALVRGTRDVTIAEEAAQDALVAALERWPREGVPENPGAWLLTAARRRAIDRVRRERAGRRAMERAAQGEGVEESLERLGGVEDDVLRLVFMACHPALAADARAALTLRLVCGLTTGEIARAYLTSEATVAQRIVRAKRTLAEMGTPFEAPGGEDLAARLASALEVIYLVFNEGYSATAGGEWTRPPLCEEALRLVRMLQGMMGGEAEVHGLAALLDLQASRLGARTDGSGRPVLLMNQDRAKWDRLLIRRGLDALARAEGLSGEAGVYTLQARIGACHARALRAEETDWRAIVAVYEQLYAASASPVVALNMAVAAGMAEGPAAGLELVDRIAGAPSLARYHLLPSVRGEFLRRLGRLGEARAEFERAAGMTANERERALLLERAAGCGRE